MAGSPKKRARRLAEEEAERKRAREDSAAPRDVADQEGGNYPVPAIIPPSPQAASAGQAAPEPTRTALKRAMRAKAQEHAEAAIAVLVAALDSDDEKVAMAAANALLDRGFGKPEQEIEAGEGGQMIVIRRFGENV